MRIDGQTDMKRFIVNVRNFANAPEYILVNHVCAFVVKAENEEYPKIDA
jgi:hypothetical protein